MELAHSDEHNEDNPPPDVWRPKVCPLVVLVLQLCGSRSSGFPDETFVSDSPIKEEDEGNGRSSTSGRSSSLESLKVDRYERVCLALCFRVPNTGRR